MSDKKRFGLRAAASTQPQDPISEASTPHVQAPPAVQRQPITDDVQRSLDEAAGRMFPNALSRPIINDEQPAQQTSPLPYSPPIDAPTYQPRTRSQREETENIFIRAPKSVADRFTAVMDHNQLRAKWDALSLLLDVYEKSLKAKSESSSDE